MPTRYPCSPVLRRAVRTARRGVGAAAVRGGGGGGFVPIEATCVEGASLQARIEGGRRVFEAHVGWGGAWRVEAHQFRIEPTASAPGEPTPEGPHRDGVDGVLVVLVQRTNVCAGETTILSPDGRTLGAFTLRRPFDAALVDDARVFHGVTAVERETSWDAPAQRDVLVLTYRRDDAEHVAPAV